MAMLFWAKSDFVWFVECAVSQKKQPKDKFFAMLFVTLPRYFFISR